MGTSLKPGWQTTELWVVVLTNLGLVVSASASWLPPRYAALGATIASGLYAIARGLAKLNPPKDGPPPAPPSPASVATLPPAP